MVFQPVIGTGGYAGWRVLESTQARQQETFDRSPVIQREIDYFRENIANATSAEALVSDRRLLSVALSAFGLGDEINKQAFVQRVLEEGTLLTTSFANRLNDPRYLAFAETFSYGNVVDPAVGTEAFREDIIARYKTFEFERAVGETDNDMRIALNFKREIAAIAETAAASPDNERLAWFQIMGNQPLRELVGTALNIPAEAAQVDIDQQQEMFADKANQIFGDSSPKVFADQEVLNEAIRRFFLNRQVENGPSALTPGVGALTLLQSSGLSQNLFLSQF